MELIGSTEPTESTGPRGSMASIEPTEVSGPMEPTGDE
jgi:hypothetical protein